MQGSFFDKLYASGSFYFFPDSGFTSGAFHSCSEFPFLRVVNAAIEAHSFFSFLFPLVSLLSLHEACLDVGCMKSTEKSIRSTDALGDVRLSAVKAFLKNELTRLFLFVVVCLIIGAILAPHLYTWGKSLAYSEGNEWLGSVKGSLERAKLERFFNRGMMGAAILLLYPFVRSLKDDTRKEVKPPFSVRLNPRWQGWKDMFMGFTFSAGYMCVFFMLAHQLGWITLDSDYSPGRAVLKAISPAIGASLIEEWLFRGVLFTLLLRSLSVRGTITGLSFFFAVVHFLKPYHGSETIADPGAWNSGFILLGQIGERFIHPEDFIGVLMTLFLVGVVLGIARHKTGYLWMSIGLHAGWVFALKIYLRLTNNTGEAPPVLYGNDIREGIVPMAFVLLTGFSTIMYLRPKESIFNTK